MNHCFICVDFQMTVNKFFQIAYRYIYLIIHSYASRVLMVGLKLQNELTAINLRWRNYCYCMIAYISKIFHQILLDPKNVDLQRIFWLHRPSRKLAHYKLLTVTYEMVSAPFLANRVLKLSANDKGTKYPDARVILKRDFYIENVFFDSDSLKQALNLQKELIQLLEPK